MISFHPSFLSDEGYNAWFGRKGLRALWEEDQGSRWEERRGRGEAGRFAAWRYESHPGNNKKADGDEPLAGQSRLLLELLSKHGRRTRFQMSPTAQPPWH